MSSNNGNIDQIKQTGIQPNKALGQNFLINDDAIHKILDTANVRNKPVLEIGPGLGALTFGLNEVADSLTAIDIDAAIIDILNKARDKFKRPDSLTLIRADFLKANLNELFAKETKKICVVANLPYYITTPICIKLMRHARLIESMTLMMQTEAARRITAMPGTKQYGPLTVLSNYMFDTKTVLALSPDNYYPQPDVNSVVIHMRQKEFDVETASRLDKLLNIAFSMRRKTLINNLLSGGMHRQAAEHLLTASHIPLNERAESLSVEQFVSLAASQGL